MVVSPRPVFRHQDVVFELCRQLRDHLDGGLTALPEVELVVDDRGDGGPATVRVPDLVVVPASLVAERARGGVGDVVAVLEVLSAAPWAGHDDVAGSTCSEPATSSSD